MPFPRFNLTETNAMGTLPSDLNYAEHLERSIEVAKQEKVERRKAKAKKARAKKLKAKKPKTSPHPGESSTTPPPEAY